MSETSTLHYYICLAVLIIIAIGFWSKTHTIQARWSNVPPIPNDISIASPGLGDTQFAYRSYGLMLQNLGNTGGRFTPLKDYNFEELGKWFTIQHALDPISDFTPVIAGYYFAASQDANKLRPLINYLAIAGNSSQGEKWRWLARAVFLARFRLEDLDLALNLARKLNALENPDMPMWAKQMPVNVLNQRGEKQAALELMMGILQSSGDKIHPNEVNAMVDYICDQILIPEDAMNAELCHNRVE